MEFSCFINSLTYPQKSPTSSARSLPGTFQSKEYDGWDSARLYLYGTGLLKKGRQYERAVTTLRLAVQRDPNNVAYYTALGDAYACRFAAVADALFQADGFDDARRQYRTRLARWQKAQTGPEQALFRTPEPVPPASPTTRDDDQPFALSRSDAQKTLKDLARSSIAAFDKARQLSTTSEQTARAYFHQGWALFLLRRMGGVVNAASASPASDDAPVKIVAKDVADCFRKCTEVSPQSRVYWHSLGLALAPNYVFPLDPGVYRKYLSDKPIQTPTEIDDALQAFDKALQIEPKNFDLLYQDALLSSASDPAKAVASLEKAAVRRRSNAILWYHLAARRFQLADKMTSGKPDGPKVADTLRREALANVTQGNAAPEYAMIPFTLPVPLELAGAWKLRQKEGFGADMLLLQSCLFPMREMLSADLKNDDAEGAVSVAEAIIDMGLKAISNARLDMHKTLSDDEKAFMRSRAMIGTICSETAFAGIRESQRTKPDERKARFLEEHQEAMNFVQSVQKTIIAL